MGTQLGRTCLTGTGASLLSTPYSDPKMGETGKKVVGTTYLSSQWAVFKSRFIENLHAVKLTTLLGEYHVLNLDTRSCSPLHSRESMSVGSSEGKHS